MKGAFIYLQERIYNLWISKFWQFPHRLLALKVALAVGLLTIPFEIIGKSFIGITLALGAVAAALSETDDYPKGRIKSLLTTLLSFFISSLSVELLRPYPFFFGVGLIGSTFFFIILGGMGERYRGITFGALLIAIYTMLGTYLKNPWYYQPILLPLGALSYGIVSLGLLYARPWRLLKEQMALAYRKLAAYTAYKAKFFPSQSKRQEELRNQLAQKNIEVVQAIRLCKNALNSYANEVSEHPTLAIYYHKWLRLQQMHERAASSHERYDLLSSNTNNTILIEGFGQLLLQVSTALEKVAQSLLSGTPYRHPIALSWTLTAVQDMLKKSEEEPQYPALSLLLKNLMELNNMLETINAPKQNTSMPDSEYKSPPLLVRLKKLLKLSHPRFRYAVRLSICFAIGYILLYFFKLEKGDWILLTSLFVCQQTYSETRQRLYERVLGTLLGVVIGVLAAKLLPTSAGQILLLVGSIYLFFIWVRKKYAIAVIFITTFVIAAFNIQADQGIAVMLPRIIDTIIGAFLAFLVVRFIWTDWQYKHLPQLLKTALDSNEKYLTSIIYRDEYDDDAYRIIRQNAHEADTALTLAWRGMKVEPKSKSFFEKRAFTLTYLNHALLSYLSALGTHRNKANFNEEEILICKEISQILKDAQILLTKATTQSKAETIINNTKSWESEISNDNEITSANEHSILLQNLTYTSRELLKEAQKLREKEIL